LVICALFHWHSQSRNGILAIFGCGKGHKAAAKGAWAMVSFGNSSVRKLAGAAFTLAILILLPTRAAFADQFQYVFTGSASGIFNSTPMGTTNFTLTFLEDTSTLDNRGGGFYSYDNVNGTLSADSTTFTMSGVTLEVNGNSGFQNIDFYNATLPLNGLGFSMVTPVGYDLTTGLNVPVTTSNLTPTLGASTFSLSGGNTLQFTGEASLGFTATDLSATPEPSSLLLLTSGLPGLALLRRRFLKA
jgi:hypothetical protein